MAKECWLTGLNWTGRCAKSDPYLINGRLAKPLFAWAWHRRSIDLFSLGDVAQIGLECILRDRFLYRFAGSFHIAAHIRHITTNEASL